MTDRIALGLGLVILLAIGIDVMFYGTEHLIFLGQKFYELLDWVAFWR